MTKYKIHDIQILDIDDKTLDDHIMLSASIIYAELTDNLITEEMANKILLKSSYYVFLIAYEDNESTVKLRKEFIVEWKKKNIAILIVNDCKCNF